ncbi:hypothetical protein EI94DRAFT_919256 [Lactarius quietus]|nr:hypothetical protein EI94DRAFT_919256 [Lactarius quietus]
MICCDCYIYEIYCAFRELTVAFSRLPTIAIARDQRRWLNLLHRYMSVPPLISPLVVSPVVILTWFAKWLGRNASPRDHHIPQYIIKPQAPKKNRRHARRQRQHWGTVGRPHEQGQPRRHRWSGRRYIRITESCPERLWIEHRWRWPDQYRPGRRRCPIGDVGSIRQRPGQVYWSDRCLRGPQNRWRRWQTT